jgi:hypothetical protein
MELVVEVDLVAHQGGAQSDRMVAFQPEMVAVLVAVVVVRRVIGVPAIHHILVRADLVLLALSA